MRLEGAGGGQGGNLSVAIQIFEVAPGLYMGDVRKAGGDILEYHKVSHSPSLSII